MRSMAIALALLGLAGFGSARAQHVHEGQAPALHPASPEARIADIAVFRTQFLAHDRAYRSEARAEAETRLAALEAQAAGVSQAYFELELGRIAALADNGHTGLFAGPRSRHFNRVEVRLVPFGEDFYVLRARAADADLLGARLVAIDGRPAAEIRDVARTLAGGIPSWRDRTAPFFLESPEQMHALGMAAQADAASYRFETPQGETIERRLTPEPANPNRVRANADRWLYPEPMANEDGDWRTALAGARAPWALQQQTTPFRWRMDDALGAMVIEFRRNNDGERRPIADFIAEVRTELGKQRPAHIVLDQRMNGGGDLNTTRALMQALPQLTSGRIFVLTSPFTFSAAISSVGYLEQAAPTRVTIVGEHVGDRMNFWSEGDVVTLPHSGVGMAFQTERHDYLTGCRGYRDCHGSVIRNPIAIPSYDPDIAAPWTIEAYLAGRDPAMEAVAAALAR